MGSSGSSSSSSSSTKSALAVVIARRGRDDSIAATSNPAAAPGLQPYAIEAANLSSQALIPCIRRAAVFSCRATCTTTLPVCPPPCSALPAGSASKLRAVLVAPQLTTLTSRGGLSRLLTSLYTRDESPSRPGPNERLRCGCAARPKSPILRRACSHQVCLYQRIDQELFGRILVGAMLVGGVTYIGHAAAELLGEAQAPPNPLHRLGWVLGLYADAALDPHLGS